MTFEPRVTKAGGSHNTPPFVEIHGQSNFQPRTLAENDLHAGDRLMLVVRQTLSYFLDSLLLRWNPKCMKNHVDSVPKQIALPSVVESQRVRLDLLCRGPMVLREARFPGCSAIQIDAIRQRCCRSGKLQSGRRFAGFPSHRGAAEISGRATVGFGP